jgi:hypothetical protein
MAKNVRILNFFSKTANLEFWYIFAHNFLNLNFDKLELIL